MQSKLRALHVIPGLPEGSVMIFAHREAASLALAGVEVRTFYLSSRTSATGLIREWRRLRKEVSRFRPDVIHSHFGTATGFISTFSTRVPTVVTFRGSDLNPDPSISRLRAFLGRLLSQIVALKADHRICVTTRLRNRLWFGRNRVTVLPGSVDLNSFCPIPQSEARRLLGWKVDERVVLFNEGHFPKVKRRDLAKSAVRFAERHCGEIRLVILDGMVNPQRMPLYMNGADCLLITSDWEGSPTVAREALACNLPIVSVEVGDMPERLCGVSHSRVVSRDPQELGKVVADTLAVRLRSNGRDTVLNLSEPQVASRVRAIYESIIRQPLHRAQSEGVGSNHPA